MASPTAAVNAPSAKAKKQPKYSISKKAKQRQLLLTTTFNPLLIFSRYVHEQNEQANDVCSCCSSSKQNSTVKRQNKDNHGQITASKCVITIK
jgi:hypothetical protein